LDKRDFIQDEDCELEVKQSCKRLFKALDVRAPERTVWLYDIAVSEDLIQQRLDFSSLFIS
jgi:hypothetical protein